MKEEETENQLEVFKANFEEGLGNLLDTPKILNVPIPPDPASLGFDERTIEELTPAEKAVVRQVVFQSLGVDPKGLDENRIRQYTTLPPEDVSAPGEIKAEVYKTNREGIFLQELTYPDGEKRLVIGPDQDV